jgi:hypothetical protein
MPRSFMPKKGCIINLEGYIKTLGERGKGTRGRGKREEDVPLYLFCKSSKAFFLSLGALGESM